MPSTPIKNGLYWSDQTETWHYLITIFGDKKGGDTGCPIWPAAVSWLDAEKTRLRKLRAGGHAEPKLTLAELVVLYVKKRGGSDNKETPVTSHTLKVIQLRMRLHWQELADLPIDRITTAEVEDMRRRYLEGKGRRSKGGANKVVASLTTVLGWAVRRGLLAEMPFKLDKIKFQKPVKTIVWPEQQREFLRHARACRNVDSRLIMLGCLTMGFRPAESIGLHWEWFDWRGGAYRVGEAKDMDPRKIPLHPVFRRVLRTRWLAQGKPAHGLVFRAKDGEAHRPDYLRKPVETTARHMKILGLHPHWLRASAATAWWENGASIAQIMLWLGHEDASTTMLYIVKRDLEGQEIQSRCAKACGWPVAPPKTENAIPHHAPNKPTPTPKRRKKAA